MYVDMEEKDKMLVDSLVEQFHKDQWNNFKKNRNLLLKLLNHSVENENEMFIFLQSVHPKYRYLFYKQFESFVQKVKFVNKHLSNSNYKNKIKN
jgi:hypothetical protein